MHAIPDIHKTITNVEDTQHYVQDNKYIDGTLVDLEAPTDGKAEVNNPSDLTGERTPIKVLDKRKDDRSIGYKREPDYQVQGERLDRPESKTPLSGDDFNHQYWQSVRNVARNYELREK
jgi:hypothetical protein